MPRIGFVPQTADLVFSARFAGAGFVSSDLVDGAGVGLAGVSYEFGFVPLNGLGRRFGLLAGSSFEDAEFFVALVESPFGASAVGADAVESFGAGFREQRVNSFGVGQFGFEAIGAFDVPGGEDE